MRKRAPHIKLPFPDDLQLYHIRFYTQLQFLQEVFKNAESYRGKRHNEILDLIKENKPMDFFTKYGQSTFNEYMSLDLWYKPLLLKSFFLIAYSTFELHMRHIAERMQKQYPKRKKINNYKKKRKGQKPYIETSRAYLKNIHNIRNARKDLRWKRLDDFRLIRNAIVHEDGRLAGNDLRRVRYLLRAYKISFNHPELPILILDEHFLTDFIAVAIVFTKNITFEIAPVRPLPVPPQF